MPPAATPIPASNSLWSPLDTVKDAAELLGISNLPPEVANVVAMDIEYRIFQITEQALKFMRRSKRKTLCTRDINKALKVLNVEPLYGYNVSRPLSFKQALVGPGQTLYYIDDNQVDFEKLINSPLPKIPRLVTFTAHWLAIEGVQPNIPQNPLVSEIKALAPSERGSMQNLILNSNSALEDVSKGATTSSTNGRALNGAKTFDNNLPIKPLIKHVLSKELQLYFNKIIQVLTSSPANNPEYEHLKTSALVSLRSDPGLHQLVPYFIQFISETIISSLQDILLLHIMLESIYSLLLNEHIFLDPYIHSLMPCILTLLLARKIGKLPRAGENTDTAIETYLDEILAIREFAASLLDHILKNYGNNYNTLKPRVARTLLKALLQSSINDIGNGYKDTEGEVTENKNADQKDDTEKPTTDKPFDKQSLEKLYTKNLFRNFGSYYGAVIGIRKLGKEIIRLVLVGNLKIWYEFIFFETSKENNNNQDIEMTDVDNIDSSEDTDVTQKIVLKEKKILVSSVIDTLRVLKSDVAGKQEFDQQEQTNEALVERLKDRIGAGLADEILKQPDGKEITDAIFFGEI